MNLTDVPSAERGAVRTNRDTTATRLLEVNVSSMVWSYGIEVFPRSGGRTAVFYFSRDERGSASFALGVWRTANPVKAACWALLEDSELRIAGRPGCVPLFVRQRGAELDEWQEELLASCWYAENDVCAGEYLILLPDEILKQLREANGSLLISELRDLASALTPWLSQWSSHAITVEETLARIGWDRVPITAIECVKVASALRELRRSDATEAEARGKECTLRKYGPAALCADTKALVAEYGCRVPPGYLVHAAELKAEINDKDVDGIRFFEPLGELVGVMS